MFGPLSIQELKDNGRYVRLTEGYLPTAQVVFLDEIWKAGPAILNTLLTVVNEKTFKNGNIIEKVPMRLLVSASNELPEEDSGLDALYDRMLVRLFVNRIQDRQNFKSMLTVGTPQEARVPPELTITDEEYHLWQQELELMTISDEVFDKLYRVKTRLESHEKEVEDLYVSDRRWKKAVKLIKASAFFNGRDSINPLDLLLLEHCLWNSPESREIVQSVLKEYALEDAFDQKQVEFKLNNAKESLSDIQQEIEEQFAMNLRLETSTGLRKKQSYHYDFSQAKHYQVGPTKTLVKLVLLQSNLSVSESEKGDSRWVYVPHSELEKVMKEGQGEAYGYVNHNTNMCRLRFELDAQERLVIKDIANRAVLTALVTHQPFAQDEHQERLARAQHAQAEIAAADQHLKRVRQKFHAALPHSFIDPALPTAMEARIVQLMSQLEQAEQESEKSVLRLSQLEQFFA